MLCRSQTLYHRNSEETTDRQTDGWMLRDKWTDRATDGGISARWKETDAERAKHLLQTCKSGTLEVMAEEEHKEET